MYEELRNTANWGRGNEPRLFPYGIIRSSAVEVLAVNGVAITNYIFTLPNHFLARSATPAFFTALLIHYQLKGTKTSLPKHLLHHHVSLQPCLKMNGVGVSLHRENDSGPGKQPPRPNLPSAEPYTGVKAASAGSAARRPAPRPSSQQPQRSSGLASALPEA